MSTPLGFIMDHDDHELNRDDYDFLTIEEIDAATGVPPPRRGSPARDVPIASDITWEQGLAPLRPHTQIHRRCGACQMPFHQYDRMLASKCFLMWSNGASRVTDAYARSNEERRPLTSV